MLELANQNSAQSERSDYEYEFLCKPDFSLLKVKLQPGRTLKVEASAMAFMDTNIMMKTQLKGGLGRFLTGESIFINEFWAEGGPGVIGIAPAAMGDIGHVYLQNETIYLQSSAFVASSPTLRIESKWQGFVKGFFSGESLFLIRVSGTGDLWFNTFGALIPVDVHGSYVVDTGCIVAFTEGLDYQIGRIGGYKSLFFSGEGLVCRFSGSGRLWLQTRQALPFAFSFNPFRPADKS